MSKLILDALSEGCNTRESSEERKTAGFGSHKIEEVAPFFVWQVDLSRGREALRALRLASDRSEVPTLQEASRPPPDVPDVRPSMGGASCQG